MMRKLLLFVSAVAITFSSIAQVTQIERVAVKKDAVVKKNHIDVINNNATPLQRLDMQAKANLNFTPVLMNHSTNLYGSLVEQQTMLSTNEDLNMVMYTHRGGGGESNGTGGQILATYSTDGVLHSLMHLTLFMMELQTQVVIPVVLSTILLEMKT
ncbi:MAG: hypothetical protein ACOXZK_09735 [Bacteroidales bacterium]